MPRSLKKREPGEVADQNAIGAVLGQRVEDAHLVGLLNARRGEEDLSGLLVGELRPLRDIRGCPGNRHRRL